MSAVIAGAIISGVGSFFAGRAAKRSARRQAAAIRKYSEYNAELVRRQAQSDRANIRRSAEKLSRSQRELQALQRMNVASRGGTQRGTDLLSIINQVAVMQEDALELQRRADLTIKFGEQKAQDIIRKGELGQITAIEQGRAKSKAYQYQMLGQFAKAFYLSTDDTTEGVTDTDEINEVDPIDEIVDTGEGIAEQKLEENK